MKTGKHVEILLSASGADLISTNLAIYEACNGLWKLATLLKTITLEDAADVAAILHELTARNLIKTLSFANIDLSQTLGIAQEAKITFYDASYIEAAKNISATLVTEDKKLRKAAINSVKTISFLQLQGKLAKNP